MMFERRDNGKRKDAASRGDLASQVGAEGWATQPRIDPESHKLQVFATPSGHGYDACGHSATAPQSRCGPALVVASMTRANFLAPSTGGGFALLVRRADPSPARRLRDSHISLGADPSPFQRGGWPVGEAKRPGGCVTGKGAPPVSPLPPKLDALRRASNKRRTREACPFATLPRSAREG